MERGVLYGKYEVGRLLGCGAFAKVYHARNLHNGQSVAIKIINKNKVIGTNLMDNVKREITIMGRLRHPNIVRLYEVMACKSKVYFVLEFAKGGELFAKVQKARFSEELSRKYFQQLISAVGFCHSRGVFHRDLKPENLLLDEFGNLKVSDFGLSAVTGQIRPDTGLLHTLCGTPAYVAPEILTKKGYDGAKIDVWSCGVILYVLTAGVLPFNDPNLMAMYKKIYKGEFRCPKWMSSELKRFLSRLLETNPKARITIDEITRDPWFKKGGMYKDKNPDYEFQFYHDDYEYDLDDSFFKQAELQQQQSEVSEASSSSSSSISKSLNAFDLIAFSSGLDLSGLFDESFNPIVDGETFLSAKTADEIIDTIGEVAGEMNVKLCRRKKDGVVDLVGTNGNFIVRMVISQLTEQLVIVEVKKKGGNSASYNNIWQKKLMPRLSELIYDPQSQSQPAVVEEEADAAAEDTAPVAVAAADSAE